MAQDWTAGSAVGDPTARDRALALLESPVTEVPAVTARTATVLARTFGIRTVRDLLEHYPHADRYKDIGEVRPIADAVPGEPLTVVGTVTGWNTRRLNRGKLRTLSKVRVRDDAGWDVEAAFFNQEYRVRQTPEGTRVALSGTLEKTGWGPELKSAKLVPLAPGAVPESDLDRIQPTYPATEKLSSARLGALVAAALEQLPTVPDHMPDELRVRRNLLDLDTALRSIHRPKVLADVRPARERLVYDELLTLQIGLQQRRHRLEAEAVGIPQAPVPGGLAERFLASLPFTPTGAQHRAFDELGDDLARPKPMHRLLQGDVGAGKTLVAAWAMLTALDHGRQAVLMAPTEVLAEQHMRTFSALLAPLGVNVLDGPRLALVTGSTPAKQLRGLLAELAVGDIQLVVGTHALLEDRVAFADLGVVIVDEQHRFGVEHRTRLRDKRTDGRTPDVLVMTATPIPRSLALTLYGDLDVTILDELPPGRGDVVTQVIDAASPRRLGLEQFIRDRVDLGERAYWVTPLVEDSDALDVASAEAVHHRLSTEVFPDLRVELVHGRLPASVRDERMEAFRRGDAPILVATTVIEVGVDVPEATVMVIEDADRFGISQLHQLRGRIGRGATGETSYCVLFSSSPEGNPRLDALAATRDGFELAEVDLELRGEGSLFDTRQSGLPDLKIARLVRDFTLVALSRADAADLVEADPELADHPALAAEVRRRYGDERLAALETG
jgi:ATP-dependent DNA helicase RecG